MPQILESALNSCVAPGGILFRHPHHQAADGGEDTAAAGARVQVGPFPDDQLPMPPQNRVRCDDASDLTQDLPSQLMPPEREPAAIVLSALAVGIVALLIFLIVEARIASPMLPLNLFRSSTFSGANLLTFLLYAALGGTLFFLPFNLIRVQGYSPTAAGAANLPFVLIMFTLSRWSGGLVARYGAKIPLIIGPLIAAAGFFLFSLTGIGGSYWTTFFPAVVVLGIGMAVAVAPLTTAVMGSVDSQRAGIASGINNAVARTAGLLAIAALGIVALAMFSSSLDSNLNALTLPSGVRAALVAQQNKLVGIDIPAGLSSATHAAVQNAISESFVTSFRVIMLIGAALALASALCSFLLIEGKPEKRAI